jgi:SPP1 family predicted phage head-tail adaptor
MIDPGALNQRLVLEVPVETPDGAGGVTRGYAAAATLWAAVTPLSAHEAVVAAAGGASVTHRILMRARGDVTVHCRLRKDTRIWRIVTVREDDASSRFLRIEAEERSD